MSKSVLKVVGVVALLCAAAVIAWESMREKTVGEQFRNAMKEIDTRCKQKKLGPYDPSRSDPTKKPSNDTQCDILLLKPYDPLATEEGRFAHSLKLPPPHDKPKDVYRASMNGADYFKALCEAEAGEWIFKTVDKVDGIYTGRRVRSVPTSYRGLVFWSLEKGELDVDKPQDYLVQPSLGKYLYLELPASSTSANAQYQRFFRAGKGANAGMFATTKDGAFVQVPYVVQSELVADRKSQYGYVWRGVSRTLAAEHGIEGGELLIFSLASNEVLAYRRFFSRHTLNPSHSDGTLTNLETCPGKFPVPPHAFIQHVLQPNIQE